MIRCKRFATDREELDRSRSEVKQLACGKCGRAGVLNCHGLVYGNASRGDSKVLRGCRFLCSPRRKSKPGCGHSFTLWLAECPPRHSIRSPGLWRFFAHCQSGLSIAAAWEAARTGFSIESAYRWMRRLRGIQSHLRAHLCRVHDPPPVADTKNPLSEVLEHWVHALGKDDPIRSFHLRFQNDLM